MTAALAAIGHNNPPEPTPYEQSKEQIDSLYAEAALWLDGGAITTQAQADDLSRLMDMIRQAAKLADERRKDEAKPHDDAKAEIQARYNLLIGDTKAVRGKAVLAIETCKKALTPWLEKVDAEKRAAAEKARQEAEAKAAAAQEAMRAAQAQADLEAREKAEALIQEAKKAEAAAGRAEKDKAKAAGGARAVTLRTTYSAEVTDPTAFAKWVWASRRAELVEFLSALAKREVDAGRRDLPGVTVHEHKTAV